MRNRHRGLSTYGLNGQRQGDEHPRLCHLGACIHLPYQKLGAEYFRSPPPPPVHNLGAIVPLLWLLRVCLKVTVCGHDLDTDRSLSESWS